VEDDIVVYASKAFRLVDIDDDDWVVEHAYVSSSWYSLDSSRSSTSV